MSKQAHFDPDKLGDEFAAGITVPLQEHDEVEVLFSNMQTGWVKVALVVSGSVGWVPFICIGL